MVARRYNRPMADVAIERASRRTERRGISAQVLAKKAFAGAAGGAAAFEAC